MAKATWKGVTLAESNDVQEVEGNLYFPPDSLRREHLKASENTSVCPWKGTASYMHVEVDGETLSDAAWTYPTAKEKAKHIEGYVAFWKGVEVER